MALPPVAAAISWLNGLTQDPTLTSRRIPGQCSHRVPRWPASLGLGGSLLALPPSSFSFLSSFSTSPLSVASLSFSLSPLSVMIPVTSINRQPLPQTPISQLLISLVRRGREFVDRSTQCGLFPDVEKITTYAKPLVSSLRVADCGDPAWSRSGLAAYHPLKQSTYYGRHKLPPPLHHLNLSTLT